jgi:hypothetical protein
MPEIVVWPTATVKPFSGKGGSQWQTFPA